MFLIGNHITMIREVHELFLYECLSKFGDNLGLKVWEATYKETSTVCPSLLLSVEAL